VRKLRWKEITAIAIVLSLSLACHLGRSRAPSVTVSPANVEPGAIITVSGKGWQPGEQVIIGLNAPHALPESSQTVTTALTDAAGNFVEFFLFTGNEPWASMPEIWVVAHTSDFGKIATASFRCIGLATPSPAFTPIASATPPAASATYVLGYVKDVAASARIITVKPIEGHIDTIALVENTQIVHADGQPAQLTDIHTGDLVEATGPAGTGNSIIAQTITLLASTEPTVTPTATRPALAWRGEYYNNTTFSGSPSLVRDDPVIDFQWQGGPAAENLPADNFAVRWTGDWQFETGVYRFYAQVNDGVRLWLDGHLIIDRWHESSGALYSTDAYLSAGSHAVKVEYFDARGDAHARLWWEYQGPNAKLECLEWKGAYYNNMTLSGSPFLVVNERVIDFNWGKGAPASGMPADNFAVRWTRTIHLDKGLYRFHVQVDDGIRLWVDGIQLLDQWHDGASRAYFGDIDLTGGDHDIRVEYYEHTGHALVKVWWELAPNTPTATSTATRTPTHTPLPATPTVQPTYTPGRTLTPTLTTTSEQHPSRVIAE